MAATMINASAAYGGNPAETCDNPMAMRSVAPVVLSDSPTRFAALALLSDAGHMFTDVLGIGMALAAITAARRAAGDPQRTFGLYRLEVLAALANAVLLSGVAVYVLIEAVRRLGDPPAVSAGPVLVVGTGLIGNALITMMKEQFEKLAKENLLEVNVVAVANSRKMLFGEEGLPLERCIDEMKANGEPMDMGVFVDVFELFCLSASNKKEVKIIIGYAVDCRAPWLSIV